MTKTVHRTTTPVGETVDDGPERPTRRRRILLMAVAGFAILGLVAILLGGDIFNPAATTEPETTMTAIQIIPLVILVLMFVVATKWPLNIGVMGLVASFGVGYFMLGMTDKEILKDFPASIVLTIIGVTYFFSMAQRNGTIDIIVQSCVRLVRGKCCCPGCSSFLLPRSRRWGPSPLPPSYCWHRRPLDSRTSPASIRY